MIRRLVGCAGLACGLVMVIAGTTLLPHHTYRSPTPTGTVPAVPTNPSGLEWATKRPMRARTGDVTRVLAAGRPVRLRIPALAVDAPITSEGASPNGVLSVPDNPAVIGWWQGGALSGAKQGTVVLAGHVDSNAAGVGALYRLETLTPGSQLGIQTTAGAVGYRMVARAVYNKTALPAELFATYGRPRLAVVTCGGPFDRKTGHYRDNVVVYAVPEDAVR